MADLDDLARAIVEKGFRDPSAPHNQPPFSLHPVRENDPSYGCYLAGSTGVNCTGALVAAGGASPHIEERLAKKIKELLNGDAPRPALTVVNGSHRRDVIDVLEEAIEKVKAGELEGIIIGYLFTDPTATHVTDRAWGQDAPFIRPRMTALAAGLLQACVTDDEVTEF